MTDMEIKQLSADEIVGKLALDMRDFSMPISRYSYFGSVLSSIGEINKQKESNVFSLFMEKEEELFWEMSTYMFKNISDAQKNKKLK